jgi:DNA polymerase III alpha subunit (gram-positive type)
MESTVKNDLCFIDIETTGSLFGYHEIIEVAAIRTSADGKTILNKQHTKLKPQHPERIAPIAKQITHFDIDKWDNSTTSDSTVWNSYKKLWENCIPICHNPSFERAFITLQMMKLEINDIGLGYHWIGTESLFWPWINSEKANRISLSYMLDYFNLPVEPLPHTAMNGANACRLVYIEMMKKLNISN